MEEVREMKTDDDLLKDMYDYSLTDCDNTDRAIFNSVLRVWGYACNEFATIVKERHVFVEGLVNRATGFTGQEDICRLYCTMHSCFFQDSSEEMRFLKKIAKI